MNFSPKVCRYEQRCPVRTFKEALYCAVHHHPDLTAAQIAERAHVQLARLIRYCQDTDPAEIPATALVRVLKVTGRVDVLYPLLDDLGVLVVPRPAAVTAQSAVQACLDVGVAHGRMVDAVRVAIADGLLCDDDKHAIQRTVRAEQRELAELDAALRDDTVRASSATVTRLSSH